MLVLENYKNIDKVFIKDSNYIVLIGDDSNFLREICEGIYSYIQDVKLSKREDEKKIYLSDFETGSGITKVDKTAIYLKDNDLEEEISLGAKTKIYSILSNFFKKSLPIEPVLLTLNNIFNTLDEDESIIKLENNFNKYSNFKMKLLFSEFTYSDIIKKINFEFLDKNQEEKSYEEISYLEKLKIKLSLYDVDEDTDKVYIFFFPENNLSITEIKKLRMFLRELSKENKVIIATSNYYLLNENIDEINIFNKNKLSNNINQEELVSKISEEYPCYKDENIILEKLNSVLKKYILELVGEEIYLTNNIKNCEEGIYIKEAEELFLIYSYLKNQNFNFKLKLDAKEENIYTNYLKNHCDQSMDIV